MKLLFLVTIDTECDKSFDWSVRQPLSFRSILEGIPQLLQPLFDRYRVKPTYLLSPEVIKNSSCVQVLKSFSGSIELGTHMHGEFVDPEANMGSVRTNAFQGDYENNVEYEKMKNLKELFTSSFGYAPTSFRAGRFGIGKHTLPILESLDYLVDSSVFPLHSISMNKITNNFYDAPLTAYFPDIYNYCEKSELKKAKLLEIPVTVHSSIYGILPPFIRKSLSKSPYILAGLKKIIGQKHIKPITLRPSSLSFESMKFVIDRHLKYFQNSDIVFLTMMFHSNEIIEGASPYCSSPQEVEQLIGSLDLTLSYAQVLGAQFIGMTDAWQIMKNQRK